MFRRLIVLAGVALLACVLAAPVLALRVKVRVEGKTTTIFGSAEPTLTTGPNALSALDAASLAGEFYYHVQSTSFGPFVDQIGRYPGAGASGWSYKVDGVSPPVGADQATLKDGDTVLWYWSTFSRARRVADVAPAQAQGAQLLHGRLAERPGRPTPAAGARLLVDGRSVKTRAGRGCVGKHRGLVRATLPNAVRSNALR